VENYYKWTKHTKQLAHNTTKYTTWQFKLFPFQVKWKQLSPFQPLFMAARVRDETFLVHFTDGRFFGYQGGNYGSNHLYGGFFIFAWISLFYCVISLVFKYNLKG